MQNQLNRIASEYLSHGASKAVVMADVSATILAALRNASADDVDRMISHGGFSSADALADALAWALLQNLTNAAQGGAK